MSWTITEQLDIEHQIVRNLCHEIARGVWCPGDSLPASHALAQEKVLNPRAIGAAFSKLAQSGLLRITSDGRFCITPDARELARAHLLQSAKEQLRQLVDDLRRAGSTTDDIQRVLKEATND